MALIISLTASGIYTALRQYLKDTLTLDDDKVRRAYVDNIPTPYPYPFVYVSILSPKRNSTNTNTYDISKSKSAKSASYILDVQLDFYGQNSIDLATIVKTLFRDEYSVNYFADLGLVPLYADDITQTGGEDEKGNFMVRNNMTLHFNIQPSVSVSQQFFDTIVLDVKNAEIPAEENAVNTESNNSNEITPEGEI